MAARVLANYYISKGIFVVVAISFSHRDIEAATWRVIPKSTGERKGPVIGSIFYQIVCARTKIVTIIKGAQKLNAPRKITLRLPIETCFFNSHSQAIRT
jgi:hypothetical protein